MKTLELLLLFLLLSIPPNRPQEDEEDEHKWISLSNNEFVDTNYQLTDPQNANSCRDFLKIIKENHEDIVWKDTGVLFNIEDNKEIDEVRYTGFNWLEAKERGTPIPDAMALEGSSFCISGKHFKNSLELSRQPNFKNMTPLIEVGFNIGTHIHPKDLSKMNFYRPFSTNTVGLTNPQFIGKTDWNYFYDPKDKDLATPLGFAPNIQQVGGVNSFPEAEQFFLQWKAADAAFFHIQRTRLRYGSDPGPYIRKLEDYVGATIAKGDKNPGFLYRPAHPDFQPDPECKNPYLIEVTEIEVNNVKLHNWLHITVYVRTKNLVKSPIKRCATGKMRYIMLEVRDSMGLPIGDFSSDLPCGVSCKCRAPKCRIVHGHKRNSMPCMFTPTRALTQPGLFMYGVAEGDDKEWFDEVHATWHFAQHSSYFAMELHFSALIVETVDNTPYYNGRRTAYRNPRGCVKIEAETVIDFIPANDPHTCHLMNKDEAFIWAWDDLYEPKKYSIYESNCPKPASPPPPAPGAAPPKGGLTGSHFSYSHHNEFWNRDKKYRKPEYYSYSLQHLNNIGRPYGWMARYTMLKPTLQTLGAWDYPQHPKLVDINITNCHRKIDEDFYERDKRAILKGVLPLRRNFYRFRRDYELDNKYFGAQGGGKAHFSSKALLSKYHDLESTQAAAMADTSDFENIYMQIPLDINLTNLAKPIEDGIHPFKSVIQMSRVYFGTLGTKMAYEKEEGVLKPLPHQEGYDDKFAESDIGKYFMGQPTMSQIAMNERCACPALGTTPDPETATKELKELQGRNAHAVQMLLAWVVLLPIGLFVARYYKETFSKVYILQEFWWFTTHVMCMGTAFVLMLGGIYSIEVKHINRDVFSNWSEETQAHVIMGGIAIVLFGFQLMLSPIRMWKIPQRITGIIMHFTFGLMNYLLGAVAVLISVAIPQSRMSCAAFYMYIVFLGCQLLLYIYMELHMRYVDRLLFLYPPRTYLPTPVIRVFHTNAPLSTFRIYILVCFVALCWSMFFIIRYGAIEIKVASCFRNLGNDYEEDA